MMNEDTLVMDFNTFKELAILTESTIEPLREEIVELGLSNRLLHGIIGLHTEIDEYEDAIRDDDIINALEELGDMLWYMAIIDDEIHFLNQVYLVNGEDVFDKTLLDLCKKTMFYGKELDLEEVKEGLFKNFLLIVKKIEEHGSTLPVVFKTIINKLQLRYPNKFDKEDAVIRDLIKERELLERGLGERS